MGILFCILITGFVPFLDPDKYKFYQNIQEAKLDFRDPIYSRVEDAARDLLSQMLRADES